MVGQPLGVVQAEVIAAEFLCSALEHFAGGWIRRGRVVQDRVVEEERREQKKRGREEEDEIYSRGTCCMVWYGVLYGTVSMIDTLYGKVRTFVLYAPFSFLLLLHLYVLFSLFSCPLHLLRPYRSSWPLIILTRPPYSVAYAVIRLPAVPPRRISPHVGSGPSVASAAAMI